MSVTSRVIPGISGQATPSPIPTASVRSSILPPFHERRSSAKRSWHERTITYLNSVERKLDEKIPNFFFQNSLDRIGREIELKFAPLRKFNTWLNSHEQRDWYEQLALFLVKLPIRAARNILQLLYNIISGIVFAAVHPLKALNHLAKLLVSLVHELTQPETWSKMGAGMIGVSLGQAAVIANPLTVIGLGIGAALLIGGLTIGVLKSAIEAQQGKKTKAIAASLFNHAKQLPEAALTGFYMGLLIESIQRAMRPPVTS